MTTESDLCAIASRYGAGQITRDEWMRKRMLVISGSRPPRKMPTVKAIAKHHGRPSDRCWRCDTRGPVDRAHLVDRVCGGLDGPQNLSLLCGFCHRHMGMFRSERAADAMAYAMPSEPSMMRRVEHLSRIVSAAI